jgi:hypothetical protein
MLQILGLICLIGVAIETARTVHRERAIFVEFGQTTVVELLVWLYPLPLAIPFLVPQLVGFLLFPIPLGILFFLPAMAVGNVNRRCFQQAGTDRVDRAQRAADHVVMSGVLAIVVFSGVTFVLWLLQPVGLGS